MLSLIFDLRVQKCEQKNCPLAHFTTIDPFMIVHWGPFTPSVSINRMGAGMMLVIGLLLKIMETSRVAPEWGCNPFLSDSILFNERHRSVDASCKRALWQFPFLLIVDWFCELLSGGERKSRC